MIRRSLLESKTMKQFNFLVLLFLVLVAVVLGADINEVRKNAINRIDSQVNSIKKLAEDTSMEVDRRKENIKIITKHEREFGDGIIAKTNFEITKTAKSSYMMANLLGSSNDVFRCIEYREREGLDDSDKYYSQKFLDPGRDYETRAEVYQRDLIKAWKDNYYKAIDQYGDIYKKSVSEVQKSTTESSINAIVKRFDETTQQMGKIITDIHYTMASAHIQVLRSLDQLVASLQNYARYRVDETTKAMQKCFPRALEKEKSFGSFVF